MARGRLRCGVAARHTANPPQNRPRVRRTPPESACFPELKAHNSCRILNRQPADLNCE